MRLGINLPIILIILISFYNCARQTVKKQITEKELFENLPKWQESYIEKTGTGILILSGPEYRYSSYFSLSYNINTKILTGKLLGSFGISAGYFYLAPDSVSVVDKEGKELKQHLLYILGDLPTGILSRFIVWDIPFSSSLNVVSIESGWVLIGNNIEISISEEFLPYYVSIYNLSKSFIEYKSYREINGFKHPFRIIAKKGNNTLEIEYHTMRLR